MAAPKPLTQADRLRIAGERCFELADRYDSPPQSLVQRQVLHDETEAVAGDVRAVVRGRGFR